MNQRKGKDNRVFKKDSIFFNKELMFPYFSHEDVASDALEVDTNKGSNVCGTLFFSKGEVM